MEHISELSAQLRTRDGTTQWRRSRRCGPNGANCVAVAFLPHDVVGVRDTKNGTRSVVLPFQGRSWARFVIGTRRVARRHT
ncbi:DUF397 domain-containing protein [Saccharothrix hoggarensis]|uniref:DUF397 domain-containing protein n=1 Tax=Saccharothrix hoggarensis TaxID=913853 RepID=A0ABW3QFW1_9PSEU